MYKKASYSVYSKVYGQKLERLKNYGVYYFSNFSITSKISGALGIDEDEEEESSTKLIFEIYMSETKEGTGPLGIPSSIDLSKPTPN